MRDDTVEHILQREKGKPPTYVDVHKPGVADKRLLVFEPEFGGALDVMKRQGSILSSVVREAFDSGDLGVLTKHNRERATGAHIDPWAHNGR